MIILSVIHAGTSEGKAIRSAGAHKGEKRVPHSLVRLGRSNGHAILVEKKTQHLSIYDSRLSLIKEINVTTGKAQGDKERSGDRKTPEGIYYFTEIKKDGDLLPMYGVMALTMNYPNVVDMRENKQGYGIWLHATDQPARAFKQFDTLGCVVVLNKDIIDISKYVSLEYTPIIIEDEVDYVSESSRIKLENKLTTLVARWKTAWQNKNIDQYMALYSERFRLDGMDKKAFRAHKEKLNRRYDKIDVTLENIDIIMHREYTVASFIQRYKSNLFKSDGLKRLYLIPEKEEYKIIGEEWREVQVKELPQEIRKERPPVVPEVKEKPIMTARAKERPVMNVKATEKPVINTEVKEKMVLNAEVKEQPGINLEKWIRSRNPSHYALQLLGVSSQDQMVSFINQYDLADRAGFIKTIRNGKEWFVLIYGEYQTVKEAKSDIETLPEYLKNPTPWIRPFKSIQESMDAR